jgi:hypothetical protein
MQELKLIESIRDYAKTMGYTLEKIGVRLPGGEEVHLHYRLKEQFAIDLNFVLIPGTIYTYATFAIRKKPPSFSLGRRLQPEQLKEHLGALAQAVNDDDPAILAGIDWLKEAMEALCR